MSEQTDDEGFTIIVGTILAIEERTDENTFLLGVFKVVKPIYEDNLYITADGTRTKSLTTNRATYSYKNLILTLERTGYLERIHTGILELGPYEDYEFFPKYFSEEAEA